MDTKTVQELLNFNTWANAKLLDAVEGLDLTRFTRTLGGSFPSVQATLTHILWVEWLWLERWHGRSPQQVFEPGEFPSVEELRTRWVQLQAAQMAYVKTLSQGELQQVIRYTNLKGELWEYPLWRQIYHLVNHSTYHRGQVITMLRVLGAPRPATDFLVFCDEGA